MAIDSSVHWPAIGAAVGPCLRPGGATLTERALEFCALPAGARIVDIGCGAGGTLEHLTRSGRYRVVGLDPSPTLLGQAASRLGCGGVVQGRAERLPFGADSFDALLCECVLSIVADRRAALGEFARVLKDGGRLVLSDVVGDGGFLVETELVDGLTELGFTVVRRERHDRHLKEFVARMILAGKPLPPSWRRRQEGAGGGGGLGYALVIAEKAKMGGLDGHR